ncbi:MAG: ATP-binding cassette domain-containing protein, partial [Spirochaetaceae bacterium]|nr:ATP-binding cassette domain-containing protein [Spirochaetaceae bacterium]
MSIEKEYKALLEIEGLYKSRKKNKRTTIVQLLIALISIMIIISFSIFNERRIIIMSLGLSLLLIISNIPIRIWVKRIMVTLPFLFVFALGNLLVAQYYLAISIMIKGLLCISIVTILIRNNSMDDICIALETLKIPHLFVLQISLLYRYIFIFSEEFSLMINSYKMRSTVAKGVSIKDVGPFLGSFILRNIDFGEKVYFAMICRGFNELRGKKSKEIIAKLSNEDRFSINIKNITIDYGVQAKALDNVSLNIVEGEKVALIGSNGAGKTTLISSILNLIDFSEGAIDVKGVPVNKDTAQIIRSYIGLIFQNPDHQLFKSRVRDDILFGPINYKLDEKQIELKLNQLIKIFNAEKLMDRYIHTLSGGEKRLVALMGVLLLSPKALLMDEPTVYLDGKERRELAKYLVTNNLTQIICTHDLDFALDVCNRVIILNNGKVVADGKCDVLLRDKDLLGL